MVFLCLLFGLHQPDALAADLQPETPSSLGWELPQPKELPECSSSQHRLRQFSRHDTQQVLLDVLFIDPAWLKRISNSTPLDFAEVLGAHTVVYPYYSRRGALLALEATKHGAECLPFRLRVTERGILTASGRSALLNYDQVKKGKLHPSLGNWVRRDW